MYAAHPVREDIGGTAESVKLISGDDLKLAWHHFYQPAVISLTMAGDFDEEPLLESLSARLGNNSRPTGCPVRVDLPDEPENPTVPVDRLTMDVTAPSFLVGFKDPHLSSSHRMTGQDLVFRQRAGRLLLDTLLSPASPLFDALYAEGLINESFGFHYACEESFAFLVCGGESNSPDEAAASVRDRLVAYFRQGVDAELFEIQKRAAAGDFVRSLDSVEHSGMVQAQCNLYGVDLFDYPGIYDKMNCSAAARMLDFLSQPSCCSVATLHLEVIGSHES
jgi:predicted Zn-dependent peptidase